MQRLQVIVRHVVFVALSIAVTTGFARSPVAATPEQQADAPVTLRIAMPAPENLDPGQLSRFQPNTRDLVENLFVGLTRFDPATHTIEPVLAQQWSVSDDGLTWTFELRDDIYWTRYDNSTDSVEAVRKVTAGDVVYAIQRACDPLRPSPVTPNLMAIKGCHTVANAFPAVIDDLFIAREIGVRANGPHLLEVELLFPVSYFPTLLSMPELRPLPRESLTRTQTLLRGQMILTNGPFTLQTWTGSGMTLIRNPHWPDAYAGNIEGVTVTFTNDTFNAINLIGNEQVDGARLAPEQIAVAQTTHSDRLLVEAADPAIMLGFSHDRAVVESAEARRALSLALDRDSLAQTFFSGNVLPAEQFTLPNLIAAPDPDYTLHDPAAARAAFERAGFPSCNNVPEPLILLVPNDDPVWAELGQAITQQWSDTFGCNPALFEVRPIARTLLIELAHATYDREKVTRSHMWLFTWNGDYPDAHAWLHDALHCQYGYIRNGRACSGADTLLDNAGSEYDTAARSMLYAEVEQRFFGEVGSYPVAPLFTTASAWLYQPWLSSINVDGPARYDLWTIDTSGRAD